MDARASGRTGSKRLAASLRHDILEGRFSPAEPFPSLRDLAKQHRIGLRTARTAMDILVKEGLLYRRERSGTFVRLSPRPDGESRASTPLRCVNILERVTGTLPAFVRTDYLQGHTQALEASDVKMRVFTFPVDAERLPMVFSDQYAFQEQGCILINIVDESSFRWLHERHVPFVVQNFTQYDKAALPAHHSVAINKVGGAFQAAQHLIKLGHRRIGYAGFSPKDSDALLEVYEGYCAAMRCAGLEPRAEDIMPVNTDEPLMAVEPALRWMKGRDLPTAFLARTDSAAIGILRAATLLGLRVPADLSVVGFNGQHEAQEAEPPLTTVAIPRVQLGRAAVELLLDAAAGRLSEPVSRVLECHLVERQSAARPADLRVAQPTGTRRRNAI